MTTTLTKRKLYRKRVKRSLCRGKGKKTCKRMKGCKRVTGRKRSYCRKKSNKHVL